MPQTLKCARCGREAAALPRPPVPGELGKEIAEKVCGDCWQEWEQAEVMVINELRLNFMDPRAQEILAQHMRDFFFLGGAPPYNPPDEESNPEGGVPGG